MPINTNEPFVICIVPSDNVYDNNLSLSSLFSFITAFVPSATGYSPLPPFLSLFSSSSFPPLSSPANNSTSLYFGIDNIPSTTVKCCAPSSPSIKKSFAPSNNDVPSKFSSPVIALSPFNSKYILPLGSNPIINGCVIVTSTLPFGNPIVVLGPLKASSPSPAIGIIAHLCNPLYSS